MVQPTQYQCIECGGRVPQLYKEYKAGIIKISHCESCKAVADKYVEYDPVIIFLDTLLLQRQAYRHLLINTQFDSHWRLAVLLWVCQAFIKLVAHTSDLVSRLSEEEPINYTNIGLELYFYFVISALELMVVMGTVLALQSVRHLFHHGHWHSMSTHQLIKAVIIASTWHILAVPALLWGQHYSSTFLWLSKAFVCLSTFQALRVVTDGTYLWTAASVLLGFSAQILVSGSILAWFQSDYTNT